VVATRAGGIPDKVEDGVSGSLVPPGDVAALAEAMAALVADPSRARAMGERGKERVRERFAWPALVRRTIAFYEELIAAARTASRRA
jgi:glycosyltransferase involved in cell wall biosynthesis